MNTADQLRTEFENNPPFEFAAEDYYKVYSEWLEGKIVPALPTPYFTHDDMINFAQLILAQYKTGNTNIEQRPLMEETLSIVINEKTT